MSVYVGSLAASSPDASYAANQWQLKLHGGISCLTVIACLSRRAHCTYLGNPVIHTLIALFCLRSLILASCRFSYKLRYPSHVPLTPESTRVYYEFLGFLFVYHGAQRSLQRGVDLQGKTFFLLALRKPWSLVMFTMFSEIPFEYTIAAGERALWWACERH